jgi:hypothetical protein
MRVFVGCRYALLSAAIAMLAGCGGTQPPMGTNVASAGMQAPSRHRTFYYTGGKQTFDVPTGVTQVTIVAKGAAGSNGGPDSQYTAGYAGEGGSAEATIAVTPGESLAIFVGGSGMRGGFNGGRGRVGGTCRLHCFGVGGARLTCGRGATDWPTALWWPQAAEAAPATVASDCRAAASLLAGKAETAAEP